MNSIAFIINPVAGGKNGNNKIAAIRDFMHQRISNSEINTPTRCGIKTFFRRVSYKREISTHQWQTNYEQLIHETKAAGDATQIAKNLAIRNYSVIVAVGGDGTVNEIAQGLLEAKNEYPHLSPILGIIPCGSGNGLARHLHGSNIRRPHSEIQKIDCGVINGKPFFCTAGIGFDALVSKLYASKKGRGALNYIKTALSTFINYKPEKYQITIDGKTFDRTAFLITFANASQWGNNGYIAPQADISDGYIDVAVIKKFPITAIPRLVYQLMNKKLHKSRYAEYFKCEQVKVVRQKENYAHTDGEPQIFGSEIEVKVYKHALEVITNHIN
jgi:YegS/Rv2252/BmrU family lipid kinase